MKEFMKIWFSVSLVVLGIVAAFGLTVGTVMLGFEGHPWLCVILGLFEFITIMAFIVWGTETHD